MKMGELIDSNPQIKEFVERCLSEVFGLANENDDIAEDLCEEMDITEDEMWWMFEQLGYDRIGE